MTDDRIPPIAVNCAKCRLRAHRRRPTRRTFAVVLGVLCGLSFLAAFWSLVWPDDYGVLLALVAQSIAFGMAAAAAWLWSLVES
mgnify:CR=1 FL=1